MTSSLTSSPEDCNHLDIDSVKAICGDSRQVMVFGWDHCKYEKVHSLLKTMSSESGSFIKKVFDWSAGMQGLSGDAYTTLEGRSLNIINYANSYKMPQAISRPCKAAMTSLVLENVNRLHMKQTPIPLIFCHDIDDNPRPFKPTDMISKDPKLNGQFTHKELRRAYKLCTHENEEIRRAALATFKFVRLKNITKETYALEQIAAPWDATQFSSSWETRKSIFTSKPKKDSENWRVQLEKHVKNIGIDLASLSSLYIPECDEELSRTFSDSDIYSPASSTASWAEPLSPPTLPPLSPVQFRFTPSGSPPPSPLALSTADKGVAK